MKLVFDEGKQYITNQKYLKTKISTPLTLCSAISYYGFHHTLLESRKETFHTIDCIPPHNPEIRKLLTLSPKRNSAKNVRTSPTHFAGIELPTGHAIALPHSIWNKIKRTRYM